MKIALGSRVRDKITGLTGIAIARTEWLNGCARVTIQPEKVDKDGKVRDNHTFDEPQVEVIKEGVHKGVNDTGGPHDGDPVERPSPRRR